MVFIISHGLVAQELDQDSGLKLLGIQLAEAGIDGQIWPLTCLEPSRGNLKAWPLWGLSTRMPTS